MKMKVTLKPLSQIIKESGGNITMTDDVVTNIEDNRNGWHIGKTMIQFYWKNCKRVLEYSGPLDITKSFSFGGYAFSSHWIESVEPIAPETYLITIEDRIYEVDVDRSGGNQVFKVLKSYKRS